MSRLLAALVVAAVVPATAVQGGRTAASRPAEAAAGTATGFVRVNGASVALKYAYGFDVPDGFDETKRVKFVLATPTPMAAAAWGKALSRADLFNLVPVGAVVEVRDDHAHSVFIYHKALDPKNLMTGGDLTVTANSAARIAGKVETFLPGDQDSFGFKVRFEIAFDAPVLKKVDKVR